MFYANSQIGIAVLVAANITMQFGAKPLFENVNVKFGEGYRYGLIGANGAGKSTFMKILCGALDPSAGNVSKEKHERMAYLKQDQFAYEDMRVLDVVMMILRTSCASNCCSLSRVSAFSRFGMSAPVKVPVIWVSRSMRSTTISTVGFFRPGCSRSFCAANTISSDLPEPWKCQIKPFLG